MQNSDIDFEIQRKVFHLGGLIFPLIYLFVAKITMVAGLLIVTGMVLYLDLARHYNKTIGNFVEQLFGKYFRDKEKNGKKTLSGSSYMAMGLLLSCLFFAKNLAITSWFILIISDCIAAIIGKIYGEPLFNGKSLAGSLTFLLSSFLISIISYFFIGYHTSFSIIIMVCILITLMEFFSSSIIDDNFLIPLSYCFFTVVLSGILL